MRIGMVEMDGLCPERKLFSHLGFRPTIGTMQVVMARREGVSNFVRTAYQYWEQTFEGEREAGLRNAQLETDEGLTVEVRVRLENFEDDLIGSEEGVRVGLVKQGNGVIRAEYVEVNAGRQRTRLDDLDQPQVYYGEVEEEMLRKATGAMRAEMFPRINWTQGGWQWGPKT